MRLVVVILLFAVYFFYAAQPIPLETVLVPRWISSVETGTPVFLTETGGDSNTLLPFSLGNRFGYISPNGAFSINQLKNGNISLSPDRWAMYDAEPQHITVHGNDGGTLAVIENPNGYPFFLDGKTFLINNEQNAISSVNESGGISWTHEFAGTITCIDSAAGLVLAGSLDGVIGVLDSRGQQVFTFEPGGSEYSIILGCAISRNGSRLAVVSGINNQRFLILERFGSNAIDYKVVYHEFIGGGFRRPVYLSFIENDRWVVFERNGGLGFYEVNSRHTSTVELGGEIVAVDHSGGQGMVFTVISRSGTQKILAGIRLPDKVILESPFRSDEVFLSMVDSRLIVGGGQTLVSFDLERR